MTRPKPKVIHVVVSPELHKRLSDAKELGAATIQMPMRTSDVVRWLLGVGLNAVEAKKIEGKR